MLRAVVLCGLLLAPLGARAELVEYEATFEIVSPTFERIDGFDAVTAAGVTELVSGPSFVQLPDFRPAFPNNHPLTSVVEQLWFPFQTGFGLPFGFADIDFTVGKLTLLTGSAALADPVLPVRGIAFYNQTAAPFGPMTINGGATGVGIGGPEFVPNTTNTFQFLSLPGAPWTIQGASVTSRSGSGPVATFTSVGLAHGPLSATASALAPAGLLRIVTPIQMRVQTGVVDPFFFFTGFFGRLEVRVVPEPRVMLALSLGAAFLFGLGRRRARQRALRSSP